MGTRVRSPSTTKARGPGETTRRHGPRHVRARASDEAQGSAPGDRPGAGHRSRVVTGQSGWTGWKSGSRTCGDASRPLPGNRWHRPRPPREFRCCAPSATSQSGPRAYGTCPSRRTPPRRRRVRPRICGGRPKRSTSRTRFDPCLLPGGAPGVVPGGRREGSPCECGRHRIARIVSQTFPRLFGGECSGLSGYIVVAAGREDLRGLGSPMTEFLPRRPRVLGSPRLVALAKEGVPPEWEPGCGVPRRQRSAGPGRKIPAPRIALYWRHRQNHYQ